MGHKCREQIKNCYNLTSSFIYFSLRSTEVAIVCGRRQAEIPLHPKPFAGLSHNRSPLRLFGGIEVTWSFSSSSSYYSPPIDLLTSHNCSRSMMIKLFPSENDGRHTRLAVTIAPNVWRDFALGNIIANSSNQPVPAFQLKSRNEVACSGIETSSTGEQSKIILNFVKQSWPGLKKKANREWLLVVEQS